MKLRTPEDLFGQLDNELSWRRADILRLKQVIMSYRDEGIIQKTLLRTAVPILYAHWEGFIKEASSCYVNFIALRKLHYKNLLKGILSVHINENILSLNISSFDKGLTLIDFFENRIGERSNIKNIPEPINTKSNLNSIVFKEIIQILELDYEKFRGYEVFIDSRLLDARNKIAHGEYREIDSSFYNELHEKVILLINLYNNEIQNSVALDNYKR